jgi:hypothetical protein
MEKRQKKQCCISGVRMELKTIEVLAVGDQVRSLSEIITGCHWIVSQTVK